MSYKIIGKYIKELNFSIPNTKTFFLLSKDISKYKINIDIKDDSDYIYVTFLDNGVGFNQVDKQKMITPYFTTKKNGTGLGLAVVTKVISDHNSFIEFNAINKGAEIKITIPKYYG